MRVAREAVGRVRPGGTLLFISGTGGRRRGVGLGLIGALTAAMPALIANLALEIAPIRVNLLAAGFVDTPLSARLLAGRSSARPFRSDASSSRPTSPRSPCMSW
jgi:NAD(P)-dependent dehydrogenase (short-subunit alcohol dehydrogenase family)